jgi:hypothetical protein
MVAAAKVILVISSDRGMQASLGAIVEEAGCRALFAASVLVAQRKLVRAMPVLILTDPLCAGDVGALSPPCPVVEFPVRTSSTGVRRIAKRKDATVKWLTELIAEKCAAQ